ncbi:MAG: hypothetical protein QXH30_03605 [Candidatus Bilamarchaeaceae archaeon]
MEEEKAKPKSKPVLFELDVNHLCWACDVTDRNPDAAITTTISQIHGDNITNVIQLTSPDVKKDIGRLRKHPLVKKSKSLRCPRTPPALGNAWLAVGFGCVPACSPADGFFWMGPPSALYYII